MMSKNIDILAIESSCDETAAAVIRNGREVLSNVISSQIELHKLYGGVVPEIASRKHIEKINQVIEQALEDAGKTLNDIYAFSWCCRSKSNRICSEKTTGRCTSYRRTCGCKLSGTSRFRTAILVSGSFWRSYTSGYCKRLFRV